MATGQRKLKHLRFKTEKKICSKYGLFIRRVTYLASKIDSYQKIKKIVTRKGVESLIDNFFIHSPPSNIFKLPSIRKVSIKNLKPCLI